MSDLGVHSPSAHTQPEAEKPGVAVRRFREELLKMMPGYDWTVSRYSGHARMEATGTQSSGFNRLSTLRVYRIQHAGTVTYEAKSAGYGTRARWLHACTDGTLARALRGLQQHYQAVAANYDSHARSLAIGRKATTPAEAGLGRDEAEGGVNHSPEQPRKGG